MPKCIDGLYEAIIHVKLSEGCAAYPDVLEQDLCLQHIYSLEPRGDVEVTQVYYVPVYNWYLETRGIKEHWIVDGRPLALN